MRVSTVVLVCSLAAVSMGCAAIRASSYDVLTDGQSRATVYHLANEALENATIEAFESRGFQLVDRRNTGAHTVLKFKGNRVNITTVSGGGGTAAYQPPITSQHTGVGSVFYVRVVGRTISMYGKPTANGKEACHERDWPESKCDGLTSGVLWSGRQRMKGEDEAEVVRSVMLELDRADQAAASESTAPKATVESVDCLSEGSYEKRSSDLERMKASGRMPKAEYDEQIAELDASRCPQAEVSGDGGETLQPEGTADSDTIDESDSTDSAKPSDTERRLLKLKSLHEKGLITDEEYEERRNAILDEI